MFTYYRYMRGGDDEDEYEEKSKKAKSAENAPKLEETEQTRKLRQILDTDGEVMETEDEDDSKTKTGGISIVAEEDHAVPEGMCVECEDQPASGSCEQCKDNFCEVCFQAQHKKGHRRHHMFVKTIPDAVPAEAATTSTSTSSTSSEAKPAETTTPLEGGIHDGLDVGITFASNVDAEWFVERSKYIPLRLTLDERKYLRLLEAALNVSDYTNKVDIYSYGSKAKRMTAQLKEMCAILSGLVVANDYTRGQQLLKDREFRDNAEFFQRIFEIGRRYKIMNPEKMRSEYGKLVYMLQDSMSPHVQDLLQFKCVRPIRTVHDMLLTSQQKLKKKRQAIEAGEEANNSTSETLTPEEVTSALALLRDPQLPVATKEIIADGKSRNEVQREIKEKERAVEYLARKYRHEALSEDDIKLCLYSIGDNHSYLRGNRDPIDKMIAFLKYYFHPDRYEEGFSLAISGGRGGARLTHNHNRQYNYVLQSMTFWREVAHEMFKLWYLAEGDLLDEDLSYRLCDTGQGLNRVQGAPRIGKAIHKLLHAVQAACRDWVGSSVVHLGDHNVPNALMFIDKYTQVARILNPIVLCIEKIGEIVERDENLSRYIDTLGGVDRIRKEILVDFFRHGFDGSGADNFFDAGSCIDGRLTSAWNWCSKIEKKPYFPIFLLTGFVGFDGEF